MDIVKYESFLEIVDRGSYSKACEDLGYTLSGISKMMKSMEAEIGVPLIIRNNKGVTLTTEGERVLPMIRQLIDYKNTLEEEFSLIRGIESGRIRIGSFPTLAFAWMPQIVNDFKENYPNIEIEIIEENSIKTLELWLNQGIIDIAIMSKQSYHTYDWFGIREDMYVGLIPNYSDLARLEVIPIDDLFNQDIIIFKSHEGIDQDVIKAMQYVKSEAKPRYTSNSDFTVIRMVEENDMVALIPHTIAERAANTFGVTYRPIECNVMREIGFAVKEANRMSPAVRTLVNHIKNITV